MRRWAVLSSLVLGVGALAALVLMGGRSQTADPVVDDPREQASSPPPAAYAPGPISRPETARVRTEGGHGVVRLSEDERARIGVETTSMTRKRHRIEILAYGTVLDLARVTELTNSYASAKAQLQTAEARADVSRSAFARARNLGQYATQVQLEASESTFRTDEATLSAAQSQVRTLAATAQQEWGSEIGRAIVERSPAVTRLIERTDFLVQVTLPPGETLKAPSGPAFAEVPPQSERVALRYVSPATRTEQRIQGVSYFYTVPGNSGLLPGMSTVVFLTSAREVTGIAVPESAVVHWQGSAWIYRSVGEAELVRHRLDVEASISDDCYVVDDLGQQTDIVTIGPQTVLSEEIKRQVHAPGEADDD